MANSSSLTFNSGNTLPPNFKVIVIVSSVAFVALAIWLGSITLLEVCIGVGVLLINLFILTQQQIVEINVNENYVYDYSQHIGLFKFGKKFPLDKYEYITAMPFVESAHVHSRTGNATTISNNYHVVAIFGNRFKGKRIIKKYSSLLEARTQAKKLGSQLNLKYFDYDPKLVREVLLGQKTL